MRPLINIGNCGGRGVHRTVHNLDLITGSARREQRFSRKRREGERGNNRTEEEDFGGFHILFLSFWFRHRFITVLILVISRGNVKSIKNVFPTETA